MKFAHGFRLILEEERFPPTWLDSAIDYKALKAHIRHVKEELEELGLNADTVSKLWDHQHPYLSIQYSLLESDGLTESELVLIPSQLSLPLGVDSSVYDRKDLRKLIRSLIAQGDDLLPNTASSARVLVPHGASDPDPVISLPPRENSIIKSCPRLKVPLHHDITFFHKLKGEIQSVLDLGASEERALKTEATAIGTRFSQLLRSQSSSDFAAWREAFQIYLDSNIFFSTIEQEGYSRDATKARECLTVCSRRLTEAGFPERLKKQHSRLLLEQFLKLNILLLRNMRFQELNKIAVTKILKKFDKCTALRSRQSYPFLQNRPEGTGSSIARAVCYEISDKILMLIPQVADFLCPVCFAISYKPVRLRCGHIFCIRCMVVLQRTGQGHCPLCREEVVMQADSENLDAALMTFLKKTFPREVKQKQKENERLAAKDKFGEDATRCLLM
ncbi:hypothetical protein MMC25_007960 [Agyrium rufum]|nr:hypothetical protein [Agyrium rufum]